jgi:hypothetical protein
LARLLMGRARSALDDWAVRRANRLREERDMAWRAGGGRREEGWLGGGGGGVRAG